MRIILPADSYRNEVLLHLRVGLLRHPAVTSVELGKHYFHAGPYAGATVLHVQWPEALADWGRPIEPRKLDAAVAQLRRWRDAGVAIVVTRHNRGTHFPSPGTGERLYDAVYALADGIVHLGRSSLREFREERPELDVPQTVIPHGDYALLVRDVDRRAARERLGFAPDDFVVLMLGHLRQREELRWLAHALRRLVRQVPEARLLITGRTQYERPERRRGRERRIHYRPEHVPHDRVAETVAAADVVTVPRLAPLNSGAVPLAFTFGRVAVGPDVGVVGEILTETGNPVCTPGDPGSLAAALEKARRLAHTGHGDANRHYAREHWGLDRVAARHVEFYQQVLGR